MTRIRKRTRRLSIKVPGEVCVKTDTLEPCGTIKETYSQTQFELIADVSRVEIKTTAGIRRIDGQGRLELKFDSATLSTERLDDEQILIKASRKPKKPGRPRSPEIDRAVTLLDQEIPWSQVPRLITADFAQWDTDKQRIYRERLQRAVHMRLRREKLQIASGL